MVALRSKPGALFLILHLWNLPLVLAGIVNRTIDDGFGDSVTFRKVTYFPTTSNVWQNASCTVCAIRPDITRAFNGTYTAATSNPQLPISITMKFNGTAIYVFFILANNAGEGITTLTLANFTLDGNNPELFQHSPNLTRTDLEYNQLVYSKQDLINAEHTLVISTRDVDTDVYVNFDYVIYTHDDAPLLPLPQPSSSSTSLSTSPSSTTGTSSPNTSDTKSSPPVGPIVAGIIGGVVFLVLVSLLLLFFRRRRVPGRHSSEGEGYVSPLVEEMEPWIDRQAGIVTPFTVQPTALHFPSTSGNKRGYTTTVTSVNNGDGDERPDPNSVKTIRRARQNEINERLQAVQREVTHLTSDLRREKGSRQLPVRQRGPDTRGNQEVGGEEETSIGEMREQLRVMKEQIEYLREQQRSAWAQGLSDDPPPGYTLTTRYSGPTVVPPS